MRWVLVLVFLVVLCDVQPQRTFLDDFIGPYRIARLLFADLTLKTKRVNKSRTQEILNVSFPCDVRNARSATRPTSVNRLRPGDIDVVGALGDSLTAGYGTTANTIFEVNLEERGTSFSIGGESDWRKYTTLPNILKVFNPKLTGYSLRTSLSIQKESQLNTAEGGAISSDMPHMTKELIKRIKSYKHINVSQDWKMITIFIGANDFCAQACYYKDPFSSLNKHRDDMLQVLRLLRDNLPRTIVIFVVPPNLRILKELAISNNPICVFARRFECPCLFGLPFANKRQMVYNLMSEWQKVDLEVCDREEFDRDDFTVVVQPLALNYTFPTISKGFMDETYLSTDCFHWSQKMHAKVSLDLWNNLMEPVGRKSLDGTDFFAKFNCPSPFIYTKRNS